jgi:fatty acid desaturase
MLQQDIEGFGVFPIHLFNSHQCVSQVFQINDLKAWITVLISAVSYSLGLFMIAKSPWYLLPLAWAWTGTAVTGVSD